jgi:hypothetical protein
MVAVADFNGYLHIGRLVMSPKMGQDGPRSVSAADTEKVLGHWFTPVDEMLPCQAMNFGVSVGPAMLLALVLGPCREGKRLHEVARMMSNFVQSP